MKNKENGKETNFIPLIGLKAAMVIRDTTTSEMAEEMEVVPQTIYNWVNGTASPNMDQLRKMAKHLNVKTDFLLFPENQV